MGERTDSAWSWVRTHRAEDGVNPELFSIRYHGKQVAMLAVRCDVPFATEIAEALMQSMAATQEPHE